jgi:hypothetical protein
MSGNSHGNKSMDVLQNPKKQHENYLRGRCGIQSEVHSPLIIDDCYLKQIQRGMF